MGFFSFRRQKETTQDSAFAAGAADGAAASRARSSKRKESEPVDPVLPEKQRARRRLVGAVALVLAAVIGLPMILDPEPKPLAHDIAIDIPSKEKPRKGASAPATAALDEREEIMATASVAGADGPGDVAPGPAVDAKAPAASQKTELVPAPKAAAAATTKAEPVPVAVANAKPVEKPRATAADDARARALLDGKPSPALENVKSGSEKSERYVVQVAALASPEKVKELQNKLKAAGIKSHTQKVATQSGERIRVRVGPVQGKPEAEKIRARLTKLGFNGTLVPA